MESDQKQLRKGMQEWLDVVAKVATAAIGSLVNDGTKGSLVRVAKEALVSHVCATAESSFEEGYKAGYHEGYLAANLEAISSLANSERDAEPGGPDDKVEVKYPKWPHTHSTR